MKKILNIFLFVGFITTSLSADLLRIEAGAGAWFQSPNTSMDYKTKVSLDGEDNSLGAEETDGYAWVLIKHPIPIIPNLRLEYVGISSAGEAEGKFKFFPISLPAKTDSTIEMNQFDIIPYYNMLDNTLWMTLDIGIDIKVIDSVYTAKPIQGFDTLNYEEKTSSIIPLLYLRTRVEIPTTNIGLEADIKYITYNDSELVDFRAKVDYVFDSVPVIQPGVEIGYRVQKMNEVTDENLKIDLDFSGVYAGVTLRF